MRCMFAIFLFVTSIGFMWGQPVRSVDLSGDRGLTITGFESATDGRIKCTESLPLFSFELNDTTVSALTFTAAAAADSVLWSHLSGIDGSVRIQKDFTRGWKAVLTFRNSSPRKHQISNVVPLGVGRDRVYILSAGPSDYNHRLSRSQLFRPGVGPIGVVLPDNAWELGFCDVKVAPGRSLVAISRRTESGKADVRRFRTILEPGGFVRYELFLDEHAGDWHEGLRMMFQERWLYDLETFDNSLFKRSDLKWARHSYLLLLQFAWDHTYYDAVSGKRGLDDFFTAKDGILGGYDAYMLWPTWPRLGLDQRNQWDMYRDLPGGLKELRRQADFVHNRGAKYFIS